MTDETFAQACAAIEQVVPRLADLVRRNPSTTAIAIGTWTLPEVACHVTHVLEKDTDALSYRSLPDVELSPAAVAAATNQFLVDDPERDVTVLADRIEALGKTFLEFRADPPTKPVTWIGGTPLPPSAVACHLLEELLVHGYDISRAAGARWQIEPTHAALAILGAAVPIIAASPQSWVRPDRAAGVHVRAEFRLRRHGAFALAVDNGTLSVEAPPAPSRADAYISADPAEWLLLMLGRRTPWHAMFTGKAVAWGRRPQALFTLLHTVSPP